VTKPDSELEYEGQSEIDRIKEALDAFRNVPPERSISAMPVIVPYTAIVGRVEHYKRGEEHHFNITRSLKDGSPGEEWEEKPLNAHAVRDEFLSVNNWSGAYDFLSNVGRFSPLGDTITWREFQRWQDFARLVSERGQLASAMQESRFSGEHGEALKALTGFYPSSFFDVKDESIPAKDDEWLNEEKRRHPEIVPMIKEGQLLHEERTRELWAWFRKPPGSACSIEWFPKRKEDADAVLLRLQMGGAMIEFLLPREALRPALVIHPSYALQAIAAAIYADHNNGIEYRTCEFCQRLFPVGTQKGKKFCNQTRCKNAAHSRKVRKAERERKLQSQMKKGQRNPKRPKRVEGKVNREIDV
jgi:hypothetical protein